MSKHIRNALVIIGFSLSIFIIAVPVSAINEGILNSQENLDSGITLLTLPMEILSPGHTCSITWTPSDSAGILWYSLNPGAGIPSYYTYSETFNDSGRIDFDPEILSTGFLYCIISTHDTSMTSMEFYLVRESINAVSMIGPVSDVNSASGISTTTPTFQWNANAGVPYYHLILSDQEFEVETDPVSGEVSTSGANIVWEVITSGTSIAYGSPDPSNNFNNLNFPPLIGDLTGLIRPTYNWVVLNCFGTSPALTSDVVGELMAFEIAIAPPFDPPVLLEPDSGLAIFDETITFQWTSITQASNYHLYLNKEEISPDSASYIYMPVWYVQSTVNAVECPVSNLLTDGNYRWKIIAEDNQGNGTMGAPSDFSYVVETAEANFYVRSTAGNQPVGGVQIDFIPIEGPCLPFIATDNNGYAERLMPYGTYILELSKVGFVTTQTDEFVIEGPGTVIQTYYLDQSSASAHGTVEDNSGATVASAFITVTNIQTGVEETTQSNNSGSFSLDLEPGTWSFVASKTGYTSSPSKTVTLQPDDNFNLDSIGGPMVININLYTLDGYVVNPDGGGVALADVSATNGIETYEYTTGSGGFYAIDVAPGTWTLSAAKPAFWLSSTLAPIQVINSGSTNNIELTPAANIVSGSVFEGSVLSAGNAVVQAIPAAGAIEEIQVNTQGGFILSLSTGNYQLTAILAGYTSPPPINLSLGVGETISGINITLTPNPSYISGKVTSDGVQPVGSALVTVSGVNAYTGSQGNYTVNVPAGPHMVTASKTGYISATSPQVNVAVAQTLNNINLTITPNAATINGTVRSSGQPVYLAMVKARKVSTGTITTLQTQQNGSYSFGLTYGSYWVKAQKTGFVAASPESTQVDINPGQTINNVNLNLVQNIGYISGSTLYNGQAVSSVQVSLIALDNPSINFNTQSGFYGTFNISVTPQHSYRIIVSKTGYVSAVDTSDVVQLNSTQDFTFNMTQLQSQLKGKVYALPDSTSIYGATVTAVKQTGGTYTAQTNTVGSYTLNMNAGTYGVTASKPGYISAARDTSLSAGQTIIGFKFYLEPNFAGLQGFVKRASNQAPIVNALVSATEVNTQTGASAFTDETGFYSFDELFQGSYSITYNHSQYQTGQVNGLVLLGGSTTNQNINLTALSGSIAGSVEDFYGLGVSGATVTAERASGGVYTAPTVSNGSYTLINLPSGTYSISAAKDGYTVDDTTGVALAPAQQIPGVDFQIIRNDGIIVGRVMDTQGLSIGGAQISATDGQGNFGNTATSSNGYFTIEDLYTGALFTVEVTKSGYTVFYPDTAVQITPDPVNPDSANFTLLPNNLNISGTVTNQIGSPLDDIDVSAIIGGNMLTDATNPQGEYTITEAAPQDTYLIITDSYNIQLNNTDTTVYVGTTSLTGIDLAMVEHSSSISGLVHNNAGSPMSNIQVKARKVGGTVYSTNTGVNGSYNIPNLYEGNYKIYATKLGYTVSPDTIFLALGVGQQATGQDFTLTPITIDISGTVYDDARGTMADVPVVAWSTVVTDTIYTGGSGDFTFSDKTPNITYQISTILPGDEYDNDYIDTTALYSNITGIDLNVVVHNALVDGSVEDAGTGNVLNGVSVNLVCPPLNYDETVLTVGGNFSFPYLHSGDYTISFDKAGYLQVQYDTTLEASEELDLGVIELQALENAIYGTISDGFTGDPLKNVVVTITNTGTSETHLDTTGSSGSYQVSGLSTVSPNNGYTVSMTKEGFPDSTSNIIWLTITSVQRNFNLIPFANSIYGTVKDESGIVQNGAVVEANKFGSAVFYDTTNYFGDYSFAPLASGSYQLHADAPPLDSYFENASLPANGRFKFDLMVLNTAKLYGTVTYDGQPPPGAATVTLLNTVTQNIFTQQTTSNIDTFFFTGLRQNLYSASASMPGFIIVNSPQTFTPTLGETDTVNFVLTATENALSGFVFDSLNLEAVVSATVKLYKEGELDTSTYNTNANGVFSFQNLSDGDYELWTFKSGYAPTAMSSAVVSVGNNVPIEQNLWLRSIPSSISGTAFNIITSAGLSGVAVRLEMTDDDYDSTFVTGGDGIFLFAELEDGDYVLSASKTNYTVQPNSFNIHLSLAQSISGKDFYLTAEIDSFDVYGYVSHGPVQLDSARVILRSLLSGGRDTTYTNTQGYYSFEHIPAPDQFQLRVSKPGYFTLVSESFDLDTGDVQIDFEYPRGQLKFFVTSDGEIPLSNIMVNVYNVDQNVDTTVVTDSSGIAQTSNLLVGDNISPVPYLITVTHFLPGVLSLQTYADSLLKDTTLTDTVILGISYTDPLDTTQINLPVEVHAEIANDLINNPDGFSISLFYKGVGSSFFSEIGMEPLVVAEGNSGGSATEQPNVGITEGRGSDGKKLIGLSDDNNLTGPSGGTDSGFTTYYAEIPGQENSGSVEYYLEAVSGNRTYSNFSNKDGYSVTALGVPDVLQLLPMTSSIQLGASRALTMSLFDNAGNLLNDSLSTDNIVWSHWNSEDTSGTLGILTPIYSPTIIDSAALSAVFASVDTGVEKIKIQVSKNDITLGAISTVEIEFRVLDSLSISSNIEQDGNEIANDDSVTFTVHAFDIDGKNMTITPVWAAEPEGFGTLTLIDNSKARYKPFAGVIGQVFITVTDNLTGISASFKEDQNIYENGLFIVQNITNTTEVVISDNSGFSLVIPAGCMDPGNNNNIILKRPPLPQVKRNTLSYEIHMDSYNLELGSGNEFSEELTGGAISMDLTLPIPLETARLANRIGVWNDSKLRWDDLGGTLSPDMTTITTSIYGFSEFAVLGVSKPLGVENLEFHPNPFSPKTIKRLQIEFILNSKIDATPQVTIKIFNMRGDLVRTLLDQVQMPKGPHYWNGGYVFQQGAINGSVEWDGLTDNGLMARNGRYFVYVKVADPSGEKEEFNTIVLIK